ncbi:MAG: NDP-sugar synthase [Acidobacteria bacterium]|nr:NDP-sugar synthase [Acidobacteriota bacterium]
MNSPLPPALVLAAGLGTRLRPLTFSRAKAAVPLAGVPIIRHHVTQCAAQGVRDAVINLHHRPETIAGVVGDGAGLGCRVRYSWERTLLGSAGGPRHAAPLLGRRFFLINGDTLCDVDLAALLAAHRSHDAWVTLAVTENPSPARYGGVVTDADGRVTGFAPPGDQRNPPLFVGVQIVEASAFDTLADGVPAATVGGLYDRLATTTGRVRTHTIDGHFYDIGTPADYLAANRAMARDHSASDTYVGRRCHVAPSSHVERSVLWDDVHVGADCQVSNCVLTDGVRLPDGTQIDGRALVPLSGIGAQAQDATALPGAARLGDLLSVPILAPPA